MTSGLKWTRLVDLALPMAVLLLTVPALAQPGNKGGGKGGGGGGSSDTPGQADFASVTAPALSGDGASYVDGQLDGGWAEFPATGNFVLKTGGKKFDSDSRTITLEVPALGLAVTGPGFMSVNSSGCPTGNCPTLDDFVFGEGDGLRGMLYMETMFVRVGGFVEDPDTGVIYRWACGPASKLAAGVIDNPETSYFEAACTAPTSGSDDTCRQWRVLPAPTTGGGEGCQIEQETSGRGGGVIVGLGRHFVEMDLTIHRID